MMRFAFIPLHRGKLLQGFTRTIVEFDNEIQAQTYARNMKKSYVLYGCTKVLIEKLDNN